MKNKFTIILIIIFGILSCVKEEPGQCESTAFEDLFPCHKTKLYNFKTATFSNNLFNNSERISIPPYSYATPNQLVPIFGNSINALGDSSITLIKQSTDCCTLSDNFDKFPSEPNFQWDAIQSDLVAVAVFNNKIKLSINGKRIENVEDIVWTWNSGMGTGSQSNGKMNVEYKDGKDVKNGQTLNTTTPLEKQNVYFWAIWAWDESGVDIKYSSRALPFIVESLPKIPLLSIKQLEGDWSLVSAISITTGNDITNSFPIQKFKGNLVCKPEISIYELNFTTLPNNTTGTIESNIDSQGIIIEDILFTAMELICDNGITGIAEYNGALYKITIEK